MKKSPSNKYHCILYISTLFIHSQKNTWWFNSMIQFVIQIMYCTIHVLCNLFYILFCISEAKALILGPDEKYIKAGSSLKLVCRFENVTQTPETVFW